MVLAQGARGAVIDRAPCARGVGQAEAGSQALEFAMVLPLLGVVIALLVQTGLLLADVVVAQGIAREVTRTAIVAGEAGAREVGRELAGDRELRLRFTRDEGLIEARVNLRSTAFSAVGPGLWVPARATMRMEAGLTGHGDG